MSPVEALMPTHAAIAKTVASPKRKPAVYQLRKTILDAIWMERLRQKQLFRAGKLEFACDSPVVDPLRKYAVLGEEFGEVGKELLEARKHTKAESRRRLQEELTQLAAVSVAMLEALEDEQ